MYVLCMYCIWVSVNTKVDNSVIPMAVSFPDKSFSGPQLLELPRVFFLYDNTSATIEWLTCS